MAERPCKDPSLFHHNRSTGRYSAWVRRPSAKNTRHYIGCYTTFHMAARAQDRAALFMNPSASLNFKASDYQDDNTLRTTMGETAFFKMLRDEARPVYNVVAKTPCFAKFQRMENHMEDLRRVTKFNIREFVAHLAASPSPNPEVNDAAKTLLEIFGTHSAAGTDITVAEVAECSARPNIPVKKKRSPRAPRERDGAAGPSLQPELNRPRTRAACKLQLATTSSTDPRPPAAHARDGLEVRRLQEYLILD